MYYVIILKGVYDFYHNIKSMNLTELPINNFANIVSINCDSSLKKRLLDLGLVPNTRIYKAFTSPFGDPVAYEFRGNIIAIRKNEAKNIIVTTNS